MNAKVQMHTTYSHSVLIKSAVSSFRNSIPSVNPGTIANYLTKPAEQRETNLSHDVWHMMVTDLGGGEIISLTFTLDERPLNNLAITAALTSPN